MSSSRWRILFVLFMVMLNVGCDQATKVAARNNIDRHETIEVVGSMFVLMKVENTGAFLSAGSGFSEPVRIAILLVLPAIILLLVLLYALRQKGLPRGALLGLACIVGGGIGNLYDRTLYGSVTDFMLIDFDVVRTGIFNMADVSIMVGVGLVLLNYKKMSQNDKEQNEETSKPDENPALDANETVSA